MSDHFKSKTNQSDFCIPGVLGSCSDEPSTTTAPAGTGAVTSLLGASDVAGGSLTGIPAVVPQPSTYTEPASSFVSLGSPSYQPDQPGTRSTQATSLASPTVAASSPISNSAASASSKGGSSLSNGAIAGVAIAALIVGAVLAFVAAFFFFKRRNKRANGGRGVAGYTPYADSSPELIMMQKGVGARNSPYVQVSQTPIHTPAPASTQPSNPPDAVASILPTAAHENEIQGRVGALFQQIHRHVDTYYRDVHASITHSMEAELGKLGAKDVNMAELLQDCSSPTTAIKHALTVYVLGITGPKNDDRQETLFPKELQDGNTHNYTGTDLKLKTASTLHRRLSVYLFTAASSWNIQASIREAAEHFSLTFFPWANPAGDDRDKDEDLAGIIQEALETRIWLFGQPHSYEFRWDSVGQRGIVVSPQLVRHADEDGEREGRVVLESGVAGL